MTVHFYVDNCEQFQKWETVIFDRGRESFCLTIAIRRVSTVPKNATGKSLNIPHTEISPTAETHYVYEQRRPRRIITTAIHNITHKLTKITGIYSPSVSEISELHTSSTFIWNNAFRPCVVYVPTQEHNPPYVPQTEIYCLPNFC
jgi:hypothetical protein